MNSPAISRCLEKKKRYPTMEDFFKWVYTYIDTSKKRVSIITVMYFQLHMIPDIFFLIKDRFHVDYKKYPQAPQGRLPQNVINPQLTRIFHTDVISTSDVKLSIYSYLTKW